MALKSKRDSGRVPMRIWGLLAGLILVVIFGIIIVRQVYSQQLRPVSNSQQTQIFEVESGSTVKQIAAKLEDQKLIKSAWAMELYIHSKQLQDKLQAGTYAFSPSEGTESIVTTLTKGKVAIDLVTILPGRRIDQVRADLINSGFKPADVDAALDPNQYTDMPVLAYKPANIDTLEGLLWPDSFQKDASTDPTTIIRQSLTAMSDNLTPDIQAAFAKQGLSTYQGIILSSIVTQEVSKPAEQAQAAQVFLSRLKISMPLASDPTVKYGAIADGKAPSLTYDSPHNTYKNKGLPPYPISTVTASALEAVAKPAKTKWLYFVSGDNGKTYFSSTLEDHEALTEKHCHDLCSQ